MPGERPVSDDVAALRARLAALPPLREVAAPLQAKKSLGQHFLFDLNLTDRIVRAARRPGADPNAPLAGETVVEVGPGPGALTRSLLAAGARVVAVEVDGRALAALEPLAAAAGARLTLREADALAVDWLSLVPPGALICANLPYNVATPLLVGWLTGPPWWAGATVMVQREVGQRLVAPPGSVHYGRLGVLAGALSRASAAFDVAPSAFVPPPKVWSQVVRLEPARREDVPVAALERVTAAAFGQRRKMLRSSLKSLGPDAAALAEMAGIALTRRAEEVDVDGFVRLARAYATRAADGSSS